MGERLTRPVTSTEFVGKNNGRRFQVIDVIGNGSHARVYKGVDLQTGKPVAIKVFDVASCKKVAIEQEAKVLADLSHDNIPSFIDFDYAQFGGVPYIVTELVEGENLKFLTPVGGVEVEDALPPLFDVARALSYLHRSKRIVHGDVKPRNIVVDYGNTGKLIDFGLALHIGEVDYGKREYTPAYASPEQVRDNERTRKGDVYCYAGTVLTTLTGEQPFGDLPRNEYIKAKLDGEPVLVSEVKGGSARNRALDKVLVQGMKIDPRQRPDLETFARRLKRAAHLKERDVVVIDLKSLQKDTAQNWLEMTEPSVR